MEIEKLLSVFRMICIVSCSIIWTSAAFAQERSSTEWRVDEGELPDRSIDPMCILYSPEKEISFVLTNRISPSVSGSTRGSARFDIRLPNSYIDEFTTDEGTVDMHIDGRRLGRGKGELSEFRGSGRIIAFVADSIDHVIPPLARGKVLSVEIADADKKSAFEIDLRGSYSALVSYEKCLASVRWVDASAS